MSSPATAPSGSPPGSPTSPTAPTSPLASAMPSRAAVLSPATSPALTPQTGALSPVTCGEVALANSGTVGTTANGATTSAATAGTNANGLTNGVGNGYGVGSGYGMGMGMDPYGMGGMSGMYGGYGGYGMGGMYGGMGMMGMGGMGMYGMGMMGMGMTPEAQRAQMMMFMTSRIMELWGMFSQVMQMTLGSAVQFVGEYVGINQRMGQLEEDNLNHEERYVSRKYELRRALADIPREQRYVPKRPRARKPKGPSFLRRFIVRLLRHVVFFAAAYFLSRRIAAWVMARSGKRLLETSATQALATSAAAPKINL